MGDDKYTGGCFCGAIRYEAAGPPVAAEYCHCRMCQRAYGNPFGLFAIFPKREFRFTRGKPKTFRSSARAERGFCPTCGTPMVMLPLDSEDLGILVGSLDDPERVKPDKHSGMESKISWLHIEDDLPRWKTEENPYYEGNLPGE